MSDDLAYVLSSLRRAAENAYPWSLTPNEAGLLVGEVERLREQRDAFLRALDHEVMLVETHDILLPTTRLRELRRLLAPPPTAR